MSPRKSIASYVFAGWKRFAFAMEKWIFIMFLGTLFYVFVLGPTALIGRMIGRRFTIDPAPNFEAEQREADTPLTFWRRRSQDPPSTDDASRPF